MAPLAVGGERVLVTGATGFIGSSLVRVLLEKGAAVVASLPPGADTSSLAGLDVELAEADMRDSRAVTEAARGCRVIFHVAALYRFWAPHPDDFYEVNVGGTLNVLQAARTCEVERVVYTSTVGTLGLEGAALGQPAREDDWPRIEHLFGIYKRSKYVAEHEVLRAAAAGLGIVLVQPTTPVGPRDAAPTPTGRTILDFLNGRMPGYVETSMNIVAVEDVALGHMLAAERGQQGRSYVLGGENLSFRSILGLLADITGLPAPRRRIPFPAAIAVAGLSELLEGRLAGRTPSVPLEGARMARTRMIFDDSRARRELGYLSGPTRHALERAARWFADNGYVSPPRLARIHWTS